MASENLLLIAEHLATKDDIQALAAQMATKEDLSAVRAEMVTKAELKAYVESLRADMDSLENKLLLKLSGILVVLLSLFRLF